MISKIDVVRMSPVKTSPEHAGHPADPDPNSEPSVARFPADHMIGARGVAADPEAAHSHAPYIERKAAAEYIDAADALADHRILGRAEGCGASWGRVSWPQAQLIAVGDVGLDRIAGMQPKRLPPGCTAE